MATVGAVEVSCLAERASRARTLISCARIGPVVDLAQKRTRGAGEVEAMAAQTSQALLAQEWWNGRRASGPLFKVGR
jgi:hypothetical protein